MLISQVLSRLRIIVLLVICVLLFMTGCANSKKSIYAAQEGIPAEELFDKGETDLAKGQYNSAVRQFEALEALYPFSPYAQQSHLNLIYAYYQSEDYVSSGASAERYIRLYPSSEDVDYAYYMKGLANFTQDRGVFAKIFPMDISFRDPGTHTDAYIDFTTLITRYPDSPYAADARQRIVYLRNLQAQRELNIAEFYRQRHMYAAVISRATDIVKYYSKAPQAEQALIMLVEANQKLGLDEAANEAQQVLQVNYPGHSL